MTDLLFADTNILIYAMDRGDLEKHAKANSLLAACAARDVLVTSPQTLNECYRVLTERRRLVPIEQARAFIIALAPTCHAPLDWQTTTKAWEIADRRPYHWWDCLMLAAAARASCAVFVTEDLQEGDEIDQMIIVNPFTTDLLQFIGTD
jgi:predicted nucleic acid-binding protein